MLPLELLPNQLEKISRVVGDVGARLGLPHRPPPIVDPPAAVWPSGPLTFSLVIAFVVVLLFVEHRWYAANVTSSEASETATDSGTDVLFEDPALAKASVTGQESYVYVPATRNIEASFVDLTEADKSTEADRSDDWQIIGEPT